MGSPMGPKSSGALLNWLLVAAIGISGTVAVITVVINGSANRAISLEAERSLLIADMNAAVQKESESAAQFVAHLPEMGSEHAGADGMESIHTPDGEPEDLADHPDISSASASFDDASLRLLALAGSPERAQQIQTARTTHASFIDSLRRLNDVVHQESDAMSVYHSDTQVIQAELTTSIQRLRDAVSAGLSEAVERSEWSNTLLTIALPIAAIGAIVASLWLTRARKARLRVEVLEHVVSEKDRFIGTVSHELRTPMAAIIGFTELLSNDENSLTETEKREYLSLVLSQGNEVSAIVDDLLVAARAEIGDLSVVAVPINLSAQARQVVETLDFRAATPEVPDSTSSAIGDPGRVRQIIRNLLTNAIRHGGHEVRIVIDSDDGHSMIQVRDTGQPIAPDDQTRMFEPYTRLTEGQPVTGSIGIGLTVSRQLARLMHGELEYDHKQGENVFTLSLPTAVPDNGLRSSEESAPGDAHHRSAAKTERSHIHS